MENRRQKEGKSKACNNNTYIDCSVMFATCSYVCMYALEFKSLSVYRTAAIKISDGSNI